MLRVADRGPGMDPEEAARVFDRFYRGGTAEADGGSGLGLFIVAAVARSLGGRASVDTAVGEGATFEVVLPLWGSAPLTDLGDRRPGRPGRRRDPGTGGTRGTGGTGRDGAGPPTGSPGRLPTGPSGRRRPRPRRLRR